LTTPKYIESQKRKFVKRIQSHSKKPCRKGLYLLCLDEEHSYEDEIDDCIAADLEIFKSSQFKYLPICWKYAKVVIEFKGWVNCVP